MIKICVEGQLVDVSTEIFKVYTPVCFFRNLKNLKIEWVINQELLRKENSFLAKDIEFAEMMINDEILDKQVGGYYDGRLH